ncbi:uncharacterized protein Dwil_GK26861 [Drosophila willistoni]|uniref:CCHC-type domain-containing protein n=1 Tax=Drosophila willistoni TaxID=7260 RepID=A0A0Q9WPP0_DROWI|nr:zinc finger CCHC domain-containing protein 8 homolog [Drosophila willistoni]KRF97846.1 uncharacterized protein Dwil_GK26861 [Drosophila willistoni]
MDATTELNDSKDVDVEDGELQDDSACLHNDTAKSEKISIGPLPQDNSCVFEIKFRRSEDYAKMQERLVEVISAVFADQGFVFRANAKELCIEALAIADNNQSLIEDQEDDSGNQEPDMFLIDTAPTTKICAAQVPSYKRCQVDVLDEETPIRKRLKAEAVNKCFRPKSQAACFNCGEADHSLRECPRPRNNSRIQRARKKINNRAERYHVDAEQRFGHIRAGRISTKTRHAMGYSRGELPFIFYRLRVLGYPPAWLEEAKIQGSGISLFNADGSAVLKSDDEDGEADTFKYDINKIIEFPGFNVQPGVKFFDDFQHHNVPRFNESQLKENFIKSLGDNVIKGYKRKKLLDLPPLRDGSPNGCADSSEDKTNCIQHDMDIIDDSNDTPMMSEELVETPPPKDIEQVTRSPTMEDLKAQQELLLEQLESNTSLNNDESNETKMESPKPSLPSSKTPQGTPNSKKASYAGTPIIKFSIYDKLPMGDKFKVGVSDVINFENLPDSTGKYEQMKDLLKNVREKMTKLQNDDD